MTDDRYEKKILKWLSDSSPQQITVCSFENALRSLLSDKDLVQESNFSFPNANILYSCKQKLALTTELPIEETTSCGSWWIDTWKNDCDCATNSQEILVPLIFYTDGIAGVFRTQVSHNRALCQFWSVQFTSRIKITRCIV